MTDGEASATPALWVVGTGDGRDVVRFRLAHGELPDVGLRARGWEPVVATAVTGQADPHEITLTFAVRAASGHPVGGAEVRRDRDLVLRPGEVAVPHQRVAAYAIVLSERGVLLSEFSGATNAEGAWGLVGGGIDPGELPEDAVHREVWEESGQEVSITGLATVTSSHWVGRAPSGRLEDFHAVRLAYWATCPSPSDPVVHDVGGTTARSAWVPVDALRPELLVSSWATELPRLLAAGPPV